MYDVWCTSGVGGIGGMYDFLKLLELSLKSVCWRRRRYLCAFGFGVVFVLSWECG